MRWLRSTNICPELSHPQSVAAYLVLRLTVRSDKLLQLSAKAEHRPTNFEVNLFMYEMLQRQ